MRLLICVPGKDKHEARLKVAEEVLNERKYDFISLGVQASEEEIINKLEEVDAVLLIAGMDKSNKFVADLIEDIRMYKDLPILYSGQFVTEETAKQVGADIWIDKVEELIHFMEVENNV